MNRMPAAGTRAILTLLLVMLAIASAVGLAIWRERPHIGPYSVVDSTLPVEDQQPISNNEVVSRVIRAEEKRSPAFGEPNMMAELLVVGKADSSPCRNAEVWIRDSEEHLLDSELEPDRASLLYFTDNDGLARFPLPRSEIYAEVRFGNQWGCGYFSPSTLGLWRIQVQADWPIVFEVVDAAGTPLVGVPVAIERELSKLWREWVDYTGTDGKVVMPHFGAVMATGEGVLSATVAVPLDDAPRLSLDQRAASVTPLRFVLPPTGQVVVLVEADGAMPAEDEARVFIDKNDTEKMRSGSSRRLEGILKNGQVIFSYVGLGLNLEVECEAKGYESASQTIRGPSRAGDSVHTTIELAKPHLMVTGRVLDASGTPLAECELQFRTLSAERSSSDSAPEELEEELRADEEGFFHLELDDTALNDRSSLIIQSRNACDIELEYIVKLQPAMDGLELELGNIVLLEPPLIASGQVVDEFGLPLKRQLVVVRKQLEGETGEDYYWEPCEGYGVCSDQRGQFETRGTLKPGEYALKSREDDGHAHSPPIAFAVGSTDLLVRLPSQSEQGLMGQIVLEPSGATKEFVRVELSCNHHECNWSSLLLVDGDGRFSSKCDAGKYTINVKASQCNIPLVDPVEVIVPPGMYVDVASLPSGSLRAQLRIVRLLVTDLTGRRVNGWVDYEPSASLPSRHSGVRCGVPCKDGTATICSPWPEVDVLVSARGYRNERIGNVGDDTQLELQMGFPVHLTLAWPVELTENCHLEVRLTQSPDEPYYLPLFELSVDKRIATTAVGRIDSGSLDLILPGQGDWRVEWLLDCRGGEDRATLLTTPPEGSKITVGRGSPEAFQLIPPSVAEINAALGRTR